MKRNAGNIFAGDFSHLDEELVEILVQNPNVRVERIVSTGQSSPPEFWYDQAEHEWVVVLSGKAQLQFEDEDEATVLEPGDHILIPARCRHRVASTSLEEPTIWLAVFYS
ncbi:MAG: cupin domain-containing protein [Planctomycetales bacterium]|nr:cupin domain-containing protein [Planctomycetales bacterium]